MLNGQRFGEIKEKTKSDHETKRKKVDGHFMPHVNQLYTIINQAFMFCMI